MADRYRNLLDSLEVHSVTLKNRIVMGSMHSGLMELKGGFEREASYLAERAKGGVGLIITGGISPNWVGKLHPFASKLTTSKEVRRHRIITDGIHRHEGAKICMQILHAGRYALHPLAVAPSSLKAPISPFRPLRLFDCGVERTVQQFVRCARLAHEAGYDGVEVMGSEGYLLNQFICKGTNRREGAWGGAYMNRIRLPLEIVQGIRQALGSKFLIIYRLSMLDLVEGGSTHEEVIQLARKAEEAGASIINSGIGWHESRVPTIASMVPRGAFGFVTKKIKEHLSVPVIAANRINDPEVAREMIATGQADMVLMARGLLADPAFVNKVAAGQNEAINTCIGCNQGCLDQVFRGKSATCLVNPYACNESLMGLTPAVKTRKVAIIGGGPAGMACAITAAERGHDVTLYEKTSHLGGHFRLASLIPGKQEYRETLRYYDERLKAYGVDVKMGIAPTDSQLTACGYDTIVVATGVTPRIPQIPGIEHPSVIGYHDLLSQKVAVGSRVAVVGSGGIGVDVALYLTTPAPPSLPCQQREQYFREWGIDNTFGSPGGLLPEPRRAGAKVVRKVWLLQRKKGPPGGNLGKTTGWIHRRSLKNHGVQTLAQVQYLKIDDAGLHIRRDGKEELIGVDNIIICAGGVPNRTGNYKGDRIHYIGGALASEALDAKRAIYEGTKLGLGI